MASLIGLIGLSHLYLKSLIIDFMYDSRIINSMRISIFHFSFLIHVGVNDGYQESSSVTHG